MTRKDYEYINKASDVCLTTTKEGHEYINNKTVEKYNKGIDELLLFIEQDYCIISGGLKNWINAINKYYKENYSSEWKATKEIVLKAFKLGYLGIKKVIWD